MKIAEVSKEYGLSADTLRYYERIGLLPNVTRTASGIRDYSEQDCARVQFVKCMRAASVSIEALIEYMALYDQGDSTLEARKTLLEEQRALVEQRIAEGQSAADAEAEFLTDDHFEAWYQDICSQLKRYEG